MFELDKEKHARYFIQFLNVLPSPYIGLDTSKLNVVRFSSASILWFYLLDILCSIGAGYAWKVRYAGEQASCYH